MGFRADVEPAVGKVDYSLPWQDLYTRAARALLKEARLAVLHLCAPGKERHQHDLPSWVPDWTESIPAPLAQLPYKYSACGKTSQIVPDDDSTQELVPSGVRVARISDLRDPWYLPPDSNDLLAEPSIRLPARRWSQDIRSLAFSLPNLTDADRKEIAMRTTLADRHVNNAGPLDRLEFGDKPGYEAFLNYISLPLSSEPGYSRDAVFAAMFATGGYLTAMLAAVPNRRPFKSDLDHLGIAPETAEVGDVICILHGATVPFILRPEANGRYRLLREAYVHGIIDGEFIDTAPATEQFTLC